MMIEKTSSQIMELIFANKYSDKYVECCDMGIHLYNNLCHYTNNL